MVLMMQFNFIEISNMHSLNDWPCKIKIYLPNLYYFCIDTFRIKCTWRPLTYQCITGTDWVYNAGFCIMQQNLLDTTMMRDIIFKSPHRFYKSFNRGLFEYVSLNDNIIWKRLIWKPNKCWPSFGQLKHKKQSKANNSYYFYIF